MLERYEWAPVLFVVGLGLVSIGSLGTGLSWWQGLRRR